MGYSGKNQRHVIKLFNPRVLLYLAHDKLLITIRTSCTNVHLRHMISSP